MTSIALLPLTFHQKLLSTSPLGNILKGQSRIMLSIQVELYADTRHSKLSGQWMEAITTSMFNRNMVQQWLRKADIPRIKVAVLDTGFDGESTFFTRARSNRVRQWKDWIFDSPNPEDLDGHGTHVPSLLMKVAHAADVSVARVAAGSKDLTKSSRDVAEVLHPEPPHPFLSFGFMVKLTNETRQLHGRSMNAKLISFQCPSDSLRKYSWTDNGPSATPYSRVSATEIAV